MHQIAPFFQKIPGGRTPLDQLIMHILIGLCTLSISLADFYYNFEECCSDVCLHDETEVKHVCRADISCKKTYYSYKK